MNNTIKSLLVGLICLAGLFYLYGIVQAAVVALSNNGSPDEFFSGAVTAIGGVLSTNLGAVLGVTLTPPLNQAMLSPAPSYLGLRPTIEKSQASNTTSVDNNQKLQVIACYFYVISLVIAMVLWVVAKTMYPDATIQLLPELAKTLLGVIVGALTIALGRRS